MKTYFFIIMLIYLGTSKLKSQDSSFVFHLKNGDRFHGIVDSSGNNDTLFIKTKYGFIIPISISNDINQMISASENQNLNQHILKQDSIIQAQRALIDSVILNLSSSPTFAVTDKQINNNPYPEPYIQIGKADDNYTGTTSLNVPAKDNGLYGVFNYGMMVGRNNWGSTINSSFQCGLGYKINPTYSVHIGTGLCWTEGFNFPFFIEPRYNKNLFGRDLYLKGFIGTNSYTDTWERKNGAFTGFGIGILDHINKERHFDLSLEYRYIYQERNQQSWEWENPSAFTVISRMNRFGFRAGWII